MALEREFLTMMKDIVTITPVLEYDMFNDPVYGDPRSYRARISGKYLSLRSPSLADETPIFDIFIGFRVQDEEILDLGPDDIFTVDDKLELPDDPIWIDGAPMIFAVGTYTDEYGRHNVKVQCGWRYHRQGQ